MYDVSRDDLSSQHVNKLRTGTFLAPLLQLIVACERWLYSLMSVV